MGCKIIRGRAIARPRKIFGGSKKSVFWLFDPFNGLFIKKFLQIMNLLIETHILVPKTSHKSGGNIVNSKMGILGETNNLHAMRGS